MGKGLPDEEVGHESGLCQNQQEISVLRKCKKVENVFEMKSSEEIFLGGNSRTNFGGGMESERIGLLPISGGV
jgi:hypothetical protein